MSRKRRHPNRSRPAQPFQPHTHGHAQSNDEQEPTPAPPAQRPSESTPAEKTGRVQNPPEAPRDEPSEATLATNAAPSTSAALDAEQSDLKAPSGSDEEDQEQRHGPLWSASEAARRCGIGRATMTRKLQAGSIPGATRDEQGHWQVPLSGLLAAGFHPDRPSPPEEDADQGVEDIAAKLAEVEQELALERGRREAMEKTSEQIAELHRKLAAEKDKRIEDLQNALRMLEAPKPAQIVQPQATAPLQPAQTPHTTPQPPQGITGRLRKWWSGN